jgi:hypothetical protein
MGNRVAVFGTSAVWPSTVVVRFGALEPKTPFPLWRIATGCTTSDRAGHGASATWTSWQQTS